MSSKIYEIIGLRELEEMKSEVNDYLEKSSPEADQIKNGYTNPLIVSNIVRCRSKCLRDRGKIKHV